MPVLSQRANAIQPSPTLALDSEAKAMKAQGLDVVNLSIGEPDFLTPAHIGEAARKAIEEGFTRYTATEGILPLREAISQKFRRDNNLNYPPENIVVSTGGKHALYNAFQCLCQEGDEVIIPTPYWVTYPAQAILAGARPVSAPMDPERLILTPESLKKALSPRSKVLVINSPSNPTGGLYSAEDLEKLAPIIKKADLWVISDDIYECLVYEDRPFVNLSMVAPELNDQVVITHGVSKSYSMTGWRIGYLAGPSPVAQAAAKIQSQMTSNATSVAQKAALAALTGPQERVAEMRASFAQRRQRILELMAQIPDWTYPNPLGAFYVFPKVSSVFGEKIGGEVIRHADDLARVLLRNALVATAPGTAFGSPEHIRLSYAASLADLEKGLGRIHDFLAGKPLSFGG
ncbi:MAG: pyridoxal phosphate-dependent aminotransferase [Deltaproteobacteria bacterium]|jgi:aspartate aminotransferase|nr:pyridoxal phosphate-dependent aminotransferase [Deltaproteobacteria bacterium]